MTALVLTRDELHTLVRRFYGRARTNAELGPLFESAVEDWDSHLEHLTAFWAATMLGERGFSGNPMAAHRRHPITPQMFDLWLQLWGETARELFAPEIAEALQARAAQIAESLKLGLFFKVA